MNKMTLQDQIREVESRLNNENKLIDHEMDSVKEQISRHHSTLPYFIFGGFLFGILVASRKHPFKFLLSSILTTNKIKNYFKYFHFLIK